MECMKDASPPQCDEAGLAPFLNRTEGGLKTPDISEAEAASVLFALPRLPYARLTTFTMPAASDHDHDSQLDGASDSDLDLESRYLVDYIGDTEEVERYEPGGYHPVHLGDFFENRYRVVHKLGSGGFSTVWLVQDESPQRKSRWLALKLVVADETDRVRQRLDELRAATSGMRDTEVIVVGDEHFYLDGPNGRHICLLLPVLGPSMSRLSSGFESRLHPQAARRAGLKAAKVLARLHSLGICHGGE